MISKEELVQNQSNSASSWFHKDEVLEMLEEFALLFGEEVKQSCLEKTLHSVDPFLIHEAINHVDVKELLNQDVKEQ